MIQKTKTAKNFGLKAVGERVLLSEQSFKQWILDRSSDEMAKAELEAYVAKEYGTWRHVVYCFERGEDLELRKNVREGKDGPMSKKTKRSVVDQYIAEDAGATEVGQRLIAGVRGVRGKKAMEQARERLFEENADFLLEWWNNEPEDSTEEESTKE